MELNSDVFHLKTNGLKPQKGRILISEPILQDAFFSRSVILIVDDTDNKHVGFILNKDARMRLGDVLKAFKDTDFPLFFGGPVETTDSVNYIHSYGDIIPSSQHIVGNIWWGGDYQTILEMKDAGVLSADKILFFLGLSGWSEGQLFQELENDFWLVGNTPDEFIFSGIEDMWKRSLDFVDKRYSIWKNFPVSPQLN